MCRSQEGGEGDQLQNLTNCHPRRAANIKQTGRRRDVTAGPKLLSVPVCFTVLVSQIGRRRQRRRGGVGSAHEAGRSQGHALVPGLVQPARPPACLTVTPATPSPVSLTQPRGGDPNCSLSSPSPLNLRVHM
ncbi:hypothetical protein AAFF_G00387290 [Aldrovandia affinis]|uniref:Uncharacterized protein n=1 Tax=Aldrovandia affinis TaxID=143900 RepID=A0AAD7SEJ8_9TELE|nr:hypothetical protein AAFF_G00387290 [Aldrovandia affinis]